jgi:hypothetical protein
MDRADQIKIVAKLSDSIRDEIIQKIQDGRIPEDWDGVELRELLLEKHRDESFWEVTGNSRDAGRYRAYKQVKINKQL